MVTVDIRDLIDVCGAHGITARRPWPGRTAPRPRRYGNPGYPVENVAAALPRRAGPAGRSADDQERHDGDRHDRDRDADDQPDRRALRRRGLLGTADEGLELCGVPTGIGVLVTHDMAPYRSAGIRRCFRGRTPPVAQV